MVITKHITLPTDEELTVEEIPLTTAGLKAASFHMGKYCECVNNEFVLCRNELNDPRKCLDEGKAVTACALTFLRKLKGVCAQEFTQYANCLDKSSALLEFNKCRKTQAVLDKCVLDNMGIERPEFGYFCRAKVHDTERPKPEAPPKDVFPNTPPRLPDDHPRPEAKYGSRWHFSP